ncbi:Hydroxyacylglutathione hydrolase [Methyloligella halotolerans]|uniref:Hydroxyacylglutathione hydrolase n=1 Tax=Methyloligella halotolerans TaxID=1177755 RepID=A0A1E2RXQ1_9HYPH|nr:quinoprotein relay system zinc metallohydrolase 2 [Methyloligella halotolerans]ODA67017.1 Hydroxyacylglutathione hydrolase [Methyloligella halotolerans]
MSNRYSDNAGPFPVTRADVLRGLTALAALPLLRALPVRAEVSASGDAPEMAVEEIAPGVFVHHGRYELQSPENLGDMANTAFIVGDDAVAVIDTSGTAIAGEAFRKRLREVTDKPIRYVINTHMHPDHVFGNAAFKQDNPEFVAHKNMKAGLSVRAETYLASSERMMGKEAMKGTEVILPTREIAEKETLDLGNRTLVLEPQQTAHTNNDLIITDEKTGTLFLGDLLFSRHIPTLDGSILGWLDLIEKFQDRKATRVVSGHGPISMTMPSSLDDEQRYWTVVADDIRKTIAENGTLEQAVKTAGYSEKDKWKLFDVYHRRNVTAAFAELEWE